MDLDFAFVILAKEDPHFNLTNQISNDPELTQVVTAF